MRVHSKRKYACPCRPNEEIENVESIKKKKMNNPVNPNFLQKMEDIYINDDISYISNIQTNELDYENYEDGMNMARRELDASELPMNFTWGDAFNNNAREYFVSNQQACGSCYATSHMYVFKRRIEIELTKMINKKYVNEMDDTLSVQSVLSCSFYDQGCNGGYPFLVSKFAMLQGIPLETEFKYTGVSNQCPNRVEKKPSSSHIHKIHKEGMVNKHNNLRDFNPYEFDNFIEQSKRRKKYQTSNVVDNPNRWYVKEYNYVGGCYGCNQCNGEKIMMNEIYRNGPIIASFEAPENFYNYKDGVYYIKDYPHAKKCSINVNKSKLTSYYNNYNITGWERVNHAIVLIGWGEEEINGKLYKYWIGKNSWGSDWGKKGYFKIIRGINFNAIEAHAMFIDPDFTRGAGKVILNELMSQ